jgi:hypothetical protein
MNNLSSFASTSPSKAIHGNTEDPADFVIINEKISFREII